jgi:biotin carboxyl carrier protein
MRLEIKMGERTRTIEWAKENGRLHWAIDGREIAVDAVKVARNVYSILIAGESYEARVEAVPGQETTLRVIVSGREYAVGTRDPRQWRRNRGAAVEAEGRQQVVAPMPGKVVRVLVKAGDTVAAGQGVAVVEAMKMQNEVRAPKSGKVERINISEGQTVSAGEVLAIVG